MENSELIKLYCGIFVLYILILVLMFAIFGTPPMIDISNCLTSNTYGFWSGLWHGWTMTITFIWSLFDDNVAVYAIKNNGAWYNFGYVMGAGLTLRLFTNKFKNYFF